MSKPAELYIVSADHDRAILIGDKQDHNDIAEFFHADHATVGQSYEYALSLAQFLVDRPRLLTRVAELEAALCKAEEAIAEYYRYQTGGETRGSYDGKPERDGLWKAMHAARAALSTTKLCTDSLAHGEAS